MTRKISIAAIVLLVLMATGYTVCAQMFSSYTWRYKITVNVETPEGIKSGSAVREVVNRDNTFLGKKLPDAGARISRVKGEAVVVDLGQRGILFGLIENGSYGELYSAFSIKDTSNAVDDFKKLKIGLSAQLQEKDWPQFITFKNIDDPKSVILIHGRRFDVDVQDVLPVDDTEEVLGNGVKIKNINIDVVEQQTNWGVIDKYLSEDFWEKYHLWVNSSKIIDREFTKLFQFKEGE